MKVEQEQNPPMHNEEASSGSSHPTKIQDPTRRYLLLALLMVAGAGVLWGSALLQAYVIEALEFSKAFVEQHPAASRAAFITLAAFSAVMVMFSSVALVPVAVYAWGAGETLFLLTAGWLIGGGVAYSIGRLYGRRVSEYFVEAATLERYGHLFSVRMSVAEVTLIKLSLPSEVPSFALGILRYPVPKLIPVLFASQLPFAFWAVYLSTAFIEDHRVAFVLALVIGIVLVAVIAQRLLRKYR